MTYCIFSQRLECLVDSTVGETITICTHLVLTFFASDRSNTRVWSFCNVQTVAGYPMNLSCGHTIMLLVTGLFLLDLRNQSYQLIDSAIPAVQHIMIMILH